MKAVSTSLSDGLASARLQNSLRSYLRRRLPAHAPVDDLVQDVLVKALSASQSGSKISNLEGWLFTAARTTAADYYRAQRHGMEELDDSFTESDEEDLSLHSQLAQCLLAFVDQLPAIYRDTLLETDIRGASMRSAADKAGLSVSAIKSRASRARMMLKQALLDCCDVEIAGGLVSDYYRRESHPVAQTSGPSDSGGASNTRAANTLCCDTRFV